MHWMGSFSAPYQITTGGVSGNAAIIYYATGVEIQVSYFVINAVFLGFALKILGPKFSVKTIYAIFMLTFLLWWFQVLFRAVTEISRNCLARDKSLWLV